MVELETLGGLSDILRGHGERPAVVALQRERVERWSYADLVGCAHQLAGGLARAGVGRGDRVVMLAGNRPEWIMACLAVLECGAVVVPTDVQLPDDFVHHILRDSGARWVFTTADLVDRLERIDADVTLVLLDADVDDKRSWRCLLTAEAVNLPRVVPGDAAIFFYTSGTTGTSKCVPLSHGNLAFQLSTVSRVGILQSDDRVLLPLPLHHVYPFVIGMLLPLTLGLPLVFPQSLTGPQLVRAIREEQVTAILGVPRLYSALYAGIEERAASRGLIASRLFKASLGLSMWARRRLGLRLGKRLLRPLHEQFGKDLRLLASGGSALDPDLAWKLEGLGWQVVIGYGLTETASLLTINPPGTPKLASAGEPMTGVEIRINTDYRRDTPEDGETAADGSDAELQTAGEILARGPNVFTGYLNLPDKTAEVFTDGWFRTGDLGHLDDDGYLHVAGRVSTLIVTESGKKVQPEDVEDMYLQHPLIEEIGVIGVQGRLVAVIVPDMHEVRQRGDIDLDQAIRDAVGEISRQLPSYRRFSDYAVTREPLPRTRLGKVRRHLLPERYEGAKRGETQGPLPGPIAVEEMSDQDQALLEDSRARQVWDWLAGRFPDQRLTPDTSPQLDLRIDSLGWLDLTLEISQRTGVELTEEAIGRIETVRDLLAEVSTQAEPGQGGLQSLSLERPEEGLTSEQMQWLQPLGPVRAALARGMFATNRWLLRRLFRLQVAGLERLPENGQYLIAPNHVSYMDSAIVAAALDRQRLSRTYWAAYSGIALGNPLFRLGSRLAHVVPIDSARALFSSLAFGAAVLKRGNNLIWFPEGRRSPKGQLTQFKPGIGMLLNRYPVPVVPVHIQGAYEVMPGKFIKRLGQITVTFGEPLDPRELEQEGEGEQPHERIVSGLRSHVARLGQEARGTQRSSEGGVVPVIPDVQE